MYLMQYYFCTDYTVTWYTVISILVQILVQFLFNFVPQEPFLHRITELQNYVIIESLIESYNHRIIESSNYRIKDTWFFTSLYKNTKN